MTYVAQVKPPLNVGQLKEHLDSLPDDTPIVVSYDCDCAYGDLVWLSVDRDSTYGKGPTAIILGVG